MDSAGVLLSDAGAVVQLGGSAKGKKFSAAGSGGARKRLSDITNISTMGSPSTYGRGRPSASFGSSSECFAHLLQENNSLLRIVADRNEEVQKLRLSLQKASQQNWHFAKAHSLLLGEHNSGKDRIKVLQHELGCAAAIIKSKAQEIQEKNKLIEQLSQRANAKEAALRTKRKSLEIDLTCDKSSIKTCDPSKSRTWRSQSLAPAAVTKQASSKRDNNRSRKPMRRGSSIGKSESTVKSEPIGPADDLFEIVDIQLPTSAIESDPMHTNNSTPSNSYEASSSSLLKQAKTEVNVEPLRSQNEALRTPSTGRVSIGRPMRKATEKVGSYKEVPLNIKMRRNF